jgi:hypothetical protein
MPIPQWVELYKNKALSGDSGTETFPIKRTGEILALMLKMRAKNGATANAPDAAIMPTVESSLTKIEVRSGSTIFKSFNGEICRKFTTYRDGKLPYTLYTQAAGGTWAGHADPSLGWQDYQFPIYFTPKGDPYGNKTNCMLPAPLYDSLDLVMDYNFTISATAGFVTGGANHVFDLYGLYMPTGQGGYAPASQDARTRMLNRNILIETKKQDFTSLASGDTPFNLTLDPKRWLRQLMVFCYVAAVGEGVDITDLKLRVNNDIYWGTQWGDLQAKNAQDSRLNWNMDMYLKCQTANDELWTRVPAPNPYMISGTAPTVAAYFTTLGHGDDVTITTDSANDVNLIGLRSNVIPAAVIFDFDQDGLMQNLQSCGVNDLDLVLTNGGAGAAVQLVEQHVSKPWF